MAAHNGEIDVFDPSYEYEVKSKVWDALERNVSIDESYLTFPKHEDDEQIAFPYTNYRFTTNCEVEGIRFDFAFKCYIEEGHLFDQDVDVRCNHEVSNGAKVNLERIEQAALSAANLVIAVVWGDLYPPFRDNFPLSDIVLFEEGDGYGNVSDEIARVIVDIKRYEATKKIGD